MLGPVRFRRHQHLLGYVHFLPLYLEEERGKESVSGDGSIPLALFQHPPPLPRWTLLEKKVHALGTGRRHGWESQQLLLSAQTSSGRKTGYCQVPTTGYESAPWVRTG